MSYFETGLNSKNKQVLLIFTTLLLNQQILANSPHVIQQKSHRAGSCEAVFLAQDSKYQLIQPELKANFKIPAVLTTKNQVELIQRMELSSMNKYNASWELTRHGINKLLSELHGMENVLYYIMTGLLAKEHVIVDGAGGGAKTLAFRKTYEAQLSAVNRLTQNEQKEFYKDSYEFLNEFISVVQQDAQLRSQQYRIFTQQMHAILSETKILGGPDPFKFIEKGEYEIDYTKALIHQKNMFAILDEIEKAPVAIQMTLLSILNERQALVGNKIIQTMLESVAATTNKTLDELIGQALPHEIGGRKAFLDRFNLKIHVLNSSADPNDLYLLLNKIDTGPGNNPYTMIDLRGLRGLLNQVQIPQEVLSAMSEITLHLDRKYTKKYVEAQEEVLGKNLPVPFYPAFSGSNRSQVKVIQLWKSAFIARQLLTGVPFSNKKLVMKPEDLVNLAPAMLQGSRDYFSPQLGIKVPFILLGRDLKDLSNDHIALVSSNSQSNTFKKRFLSEGDFDPRTGIFRYVSLAPGNPVRQVYFDAKSGKIHYPDAYTKAEIVQDLNIPALWQLPGQIKNRYGNLEKTLAYLHNKAMSGKMKLFNEGYSVLQYEDQNWMGNYIEHAPLRRSTKKQLQIIKELQDEFKNIVNAKIQELNGQQLTKVNDGGLLKIIRTIESKSEENNQSIKAYATTTREHKKEEYAAESVRLVAEEMKVKFLGTENTIKSMLLALINRNNIMIFGPPGSAKTMTARMMLDSAISGLKETQLAKMNADLAEALQRQGLGNGGIWVRQFHPMSNEGDILGRIDLKKLREGHGYSYNRTGTLSAKDVFFALLDEFEKAPPGVRTSLLSLLNEREVMDGDDVVRSNLISVMITTNSTPSEFMQSQGDFSTAFPVFDRIQNKAYALNKLTEDQLKELHRRIYLGVKLDLKAHLYLEPLWKLKKEFKIDEDEKMLLSRIHQKFMKKIVDLSEASIEAFEADPSSNPDYFMNTRGESNRSAQSVILKEFSGNVLLNRILEGQDPYDLRVDGFRFDLSDLEAFSELYMTSNPIYRIVKGTDSMNRIEFKLEEKDLSELFDRIDLRERKTMEFFKQEAEIFVDVLNSEVRDFFQLRLELIAKHPKLYPNAFASNEDRVKYLLKSGIKEEDINIEDLE